MRRFAIVGSLAGFLLVAACGGPTATPSAAPAASPTSESGSNLTAGVVELRTTSTALGDVVSDDRGRTLYLFTKDVKGARSSACTGPCLVTWPPAMAAAEPPRLTGVTGVVGTIGTADGRNQLTLSGWPLYYFAGDAAPGAVLGQGVGGVWYVLDAAGNPVKTPVGEAPGAGY